MIAAMDSLGELEGFEPQIRARSNTWPLPRPDNFIDIDSIKKEPDDGDLGKSGSDPSTHPEDLEGPVKMEPEGENSRSDLWSNPSPETFDNGPVKTEPEDENSRSHLWSNSSPETLDNGPVKMEYEDANSRPDLWSNPYPETYDIVPMKLEPVAVNSGTSSSQTWSSPRPEASMDVDEGVSQSRPWLDPCPANYTELVKKEDLCQSSPESWTFQKPGSKDLDPIREKTNDQGHMRPWESPKPGCSKDFGPMRKDSSGKPRCLTWPFPKPGCSGQKTGGRGLSRPQEWPSPKPGCSKDFGPSRNKSACGSLGADGGAGSSMGIPGAKKPTSRRNAWGNLSYADLISQAISSVPERRLTLSQIYEWMVQNVPYFKDKGDSNSSAGWKNSIRHNLSLHNRFMRVQNEGTGKSSWWMINPDAKPGKSSRRRAGSMETSKFEKRRGRVRKKVEALRNGTLPAEATPSPSSSVSEGLDRFPDSPLYTSSGFQLSPDFRPRASSNASSCGRLSPIPNSENDWSGPGSYPSGGFEELAGNLADGMKLHNDSFTLGGYANYQPFETYRPAAAAPYVAQCPLHRVHGCNCTLAPDGMSPSGLSPSYPQSEPSPSPMGGAQPGYPASQPQATPRRPTASTMMGQFIGALNHPAVLDDLNLNIETMPGGFECNVDEVIRHELSMEGTLDFNFPGQVSLSQTVSDSSQGGSSYNAVNMSGPSWVH